MSRAMITESYLTDIANAIRAKNGSSDTYTPPQMAAAIESIPTGITPTGTVNITQNGTHDVTQYASANVNVQPNLQSKTVTENGTVTPDQGYDGLSSVVVNVQGGGGQKPYTIPAEFQEVEYLGFSGSQFIVAPVSASKHQVLGVRALIGSSASNVEQDITGFDAGESIYFESNKVMPYQFDYNIREAALSITRDTPFNFSAILGSNKNANLIIGRYKSSGSNPHPIEAGRVYAVRLMHIASMDLEIANDYWFVPCVRKNDDTAGFYEAINGNFYTNQGTGEFIAGPDVN